MWSRASSRSRWVRIAAWVAIGWGLGACDPPEPVLVAISDPQAGGPDDQGEDEERVESGEYQRPEAVYVDVRWLGGRRLTTARGELVEQMGLVSEHRDLGGRFGEELVLTRGTVRVVRDVIYMIRVDLPRPVTRTEALVMTGFEPWAEDWASTHREYRLRHAWGFDRLRLLRAEGYADRVIRLEAWKKSAGDVRSR